MNGSMKDTKVIVVHSRELVSDIVEKLQNLRDDGRGWVVYPAVIRKVSRVSNTDEEGKEVTDVVIRDTNSTLVIVDEQRYNALKEAEYFVRGKHKDFWVTDFQPKISKNANHVIKVSVPRHVALQQAMAFLQGLVRSLNVQCTVRMNYKDRRTGAHTGYAIMFFDSKTSVEDVVTTKFYLGNLMWPVLGEDGTPYNVRAFWGMSKEELEARRSATESAEKVLAEE